ncbi:MAG TPA: hypothetical protein PLB55_14720, partial [Prosthecobacter sp.]|nr:hypothetical protein [Prosthecobacter sp.]
MGVKTMVGAEGDRQQSKLPDAEPPGKWTPAEKKGGKWKSALPPVELVEVIDDAIIPSAPSVETSPLLAADFGVAIPDPA